VFSQTKLLVIIHADKVSAENETNFQWNLDSLLKPLVVEIHRRSSRHVRSNDMPKSENKIDTKNHMKTILIL
jgi:hypothetical protein